MQVQDIEMKTKRGGRPARLAALAEAIARACEKRPFWLLCAHSVLYLLVVGLIAVRKQLENDELFTLNIARLPTISDVWSALLTGAEQLPPFFYVLTRASLSLFGESNIALRLPSILGFWVMSLCLFWFVSKRSTSLYGLAAILFVLTTGAYYYAFEARPYALVLGFSGLALICWQSLAEGKRRALSLIGLALTLAAAVACHYYAVLVLIPFACGEAARTLARRRADIPAWAALAASLAPLLIFLPLIKSARAYSKTFWAQPSWGDIPGFYYFMLMSAALPIAAILILVALYSTIFSERGPETGCEINDAPGFGLLPHEVAAVVGFLAIPFVAVTMAMLVTGAFTDRYALAAVLGLGVLMPFSFHPLLRGREVLMILLVLCLAAGFVRRAGMTLQDSAKRVQSREGTVRMLQAEPEKDLPIVCSDPHAFLVLSHYAPPDIRSRLIYLADPEASLRYLGHNSIEQGMFDLLKPRFRLNVQTYRPFLASGKPFLLCGSTEHFLNWLLTDVVSSGAHLELKGRNQDVLLFLVSARGSARSAGAGDARNGKRAE
jgi:hypothetical protein